MATVSWGRGFTPMTVHRIYYILSPQSPLRGGGNMYTSSHIAFTTAKLRPELHKQSGTHLGILQNEPLHNM